VRRFHLVRDKDPSGLTGTGIVAEGGQAQDGTVVLVWRGERPSVVVREPRGPEHDVMADVIAVHGHEGKTSIVWLDDDDDDGSFPRASRVAASQERELRELHTELRNCQNRYALLERRLSRAAQALRGGPI
jgi:hypothetical protein